MIRPDSVIIEFGRHRFGDNAGQLGVGINRDRLKDLTDQELINLQQLMKNTFEVLVHEAQFRRVKETKAIVEEPKKEIT